MSHKNKEINNSSFSRFDDDSVKGNKIFNKKIKNIKHIELLCYNSLFLTTLKAVSN